MPWNWKTEAQVVECYRKIQRMREVEGLTLADAARRLGINPTSTQGFLKRAKRILEKEEGIHASK